MYLRYTKRQNRDGSTVGYYALAENAWNPGTQRSEAKVVHSFDRVGFVWVARTPLVDQRIGQPHGIPKRRRILEA